jgi:CBS domain-containing protein
LGVSAAALTGGGRVGVEVEEVDRLGGKSRVSLPGSRILQVADVMTAPPPVVPSHLTMAAARKIAALKSASLLVVEIEGTIVGVVDAEALANAPDDDLVADRMTTSMLAVAPSVSATQARGLLARIGAPSLPVVVGMFVVGSVSREAIERALAARAPTARQITRAAA